MRHHAQAARHHAQATRHHAQAARHHAQVTRNKGETAPRVIMLMQATGKPLHTRSKRSVQMLHANAACKLSCV